MKCNLFGMITYFEYIYIYTIFIGVFFTVTIDCFHHFYLGNVRPAFMRIADEDIVMWKIFGQYLDCFQRKMVLFGDKEQQSQCM